MKSDFQDAILSIALPGLRHIQPYQPGKPVEELERELGVTNAVKLASNENPLGMSDSAQQAITKSLDEGSRYPDGNAFYLKQKLSERLAVSPDQLTIGNGSNEILELLGRAFLSHGMNAVVSEHAFVVYDLTITAQSAEARKIPAVDWGHDIDSMADAVDDQTRMVFIANPNNPTGTWVSAAKIESLLEKMPSTVIVVVDEAYFEYADFGGNTRGYQTALPLLEKFPNLIITRTFSKAYGLASLRVGYSISHPVIAELLNRLRQPFNVNSLALAAAEAVLNDEGFLEESLTLNHQGYQQITEGLQAQGLSWIPSAGNFIAIDVGEQAEQIYQQLLRAGVIVRPIASYGMVNYLRVSIGLAEENERFLVALASILVQLESFSE